MVLDYYDFTEQPFGVSPDPRYLHLTATHREALASLYYGLSSRQGFVSLIAKPGMGKTTLLFRLLQQLDSSTRTVFLFQTSCTPEDLLRSVLYDLGVPSYVDDDIIRMQARLNEILVGESRQGRRVVLVVDEAQNLSTTSLELLRMLSNFETPREKMIQMILAGQPELADKLASRELLQLRQRISINARLKPFTLEETSLYIDHRLHIAGYARPQSLFSRSARVLVQEHSEGIPRNINKICFNALALGCGMKQKTIGPDVIEEVMEDLDFTSWGKDSPLRQSAPLFQTLEGMASGGKSSGLLSLMSKLALIAIFLVALISDSSANRAPKIAVNLQRVGALSPLSTKKGYPATPISSVGFDRIEDQPIKAIRGNLESSPGVVTGALVPRPAPEVPRNRSSSSSASVQRADPAQLWKQVGKADANAAVSLAKLYIEGSGVPQDCEQAELLLRSASRSGDKDATQLLSQLDARKCH